MNNFLYPFSHISEISRKKCEKIKKKSRMKKRESLKFAYIVYYKYTTFCKTFNTYYHLIHITYCIYW